MNNSIEILDNKLFNNIIEIIKNRILISNY